MSERLVSMLVPLQCVFADAETHRIAKLSRDSINPPAGEDTVGPWETREDPTAVPRLPPPVATMLGWEVVHARSTLPTFVDPPPFFC